MGGVGSIPFGGTAHHVHKAIITAMNNYAMSMNNYASCKKILAIYASYVIIRNRCIGDALPYVVGHNLMNCRH